MTQCQHITPYMAAKNLMKPKQCINTTVGLFCKDHAYCQELLDLARTLDYPQLPITASMYIMAGYGGWLAYVEHHPRARHEAIKAALAEMIGQRAEARL